MSLSKEEIDQIAEALAPKLVSNVRKGHHEFWIDPEEHYNDHKRCRVLTTEDHYELKQLVGLFKTAKGIWFRAFIGAAIVGTVVLFAISLGYHK